MKGITWRDWWVIIFAALKLTGALHIGWGVVFFPYIVAFAVLIIILFLVMMI